MIYLRSILWLIELVPNFSLGVNSAISLQNFPYKYFPTILGKILDFPVYWEYNVNNLNKGGIAFFIPLVGLICSILGLNKASKEGLPYKGLALAGIIISVVVWVLSFIISITILPDIMV